jgi:hypothetical protein
MGLKLAVTVCATKNYCYAMNSLARRVQANLYYLNSGEVDDVLLIVSGDNSKECLSSVSFWKDIFSDHKVIHLNVLTEDEKAENYKSTAQLTIAKLREAAFVSARKNNCDFCWSLDSDTLPPANALRCMLDMLRFDCGYYSIAACPYPNREFLGGFGTYQNPIAEDFLMSERKVPDDLKAEFESNEKELKDYLEKHKDNPQQPTDEMQKRWEATNKKIKDCPPDGNIWEVISKYGWRRRGWFSNAYPAIGQGSVVPIDWQGFGCTLMNKYALSLASFHGYEGKGTEDLWVWWQHWNPNGLRTCNVAHCPCDHVIATRKKDGNKDKNEFQHIVSFHERTGEHKGHLRTKTVPWLYD